jgi:hypothetical protein
MAFQPPPSGLRAILGDSYKWLAKFMTTSLSDTISWAFNAAQAGSNAGLVAWPTSGNVNFAYCPNSAETPAAATINWRVVRRIP